jgi:hypothetical protein
MIVAVAEGVAGAVWVLVSVAVAGNGVGEAIAVPVGVDVVVGNPVVEVVVDVDVCSTTADGVGVSSACETGLRTSCSLQATKNSIKANNLKLCQMPL